MSTNTSNHLVNPAAREAMDKFKMEAAAEVGVNLKNGYNGELTSRQAGSVGGSGQEDDRGLRERHEVSLKKLGFIQNCGAALLLLQFCYIQ